MPENSRWDLIQSLKG